MTSLTRSSSPRSFICGAHQNPPSFGAEFLSWQVAKVLTYEILVYLIVKKFKWNNSMHSNGEVGRFSVTQNIVDRDYSCQKLARYWQESRNAGPSNMVKKHGFQK